MSYTKVAIITGSNKGIGFGMVKHLCSKFDGDIYLTSRNDERGLEAVKKLKSEGLKVCYHQLDIDNDESVSRFKADILKKHSGIDLLINNAAIKGGDSTPLAERVELTMKTNFFSNFNFSKALLPHMNKDGRVVNMSSGLALTGLRSCSRLLQKEFKSETMSEEQLVQRMREYVRYAKQNRLQENGWPSYPYGVSKLAVVIMSRLHGAWLQQHHSDQNVLLNACCPGWVKTDMGGQGAPLSVEEGIETPMYLALLPPGSSTPNGEFLLQKKVRKWYR